MSTTLKIEASDGCPLTVHVLREGDASLRPIVFVHALAMDGLMWRTTADALDSRATMYAIDCRGHGASGKPAGPYTTRRFAEDIVNLLDRVNAPGAHIVGCSMGGTVALALAGWVPQRIASLSVIDSTAWYGAEAPTNWETRAQRALKEGLSSLIPFQVERWFSAGFATTEPATLQQTIDVFLRNEPAAYAETCRMLGQADERAQVANYRGPASIVVGEEDYATPPAMSQDIAARLTNSTLTVLSKVRHYTPIEVPSAVAACIASAMARSSADQGAAR